MLLFSVPVPLSLIGTYTQEGGQETETGSVIISGGVHFCRTRVWVEWVQGRIPAPGAPGSALGEAPLLQAVEAEDSLLDKVPLGPSPGLDLKPMLEGGDAGDLWPLPGLPVCRVSSQG